ncbi:MAG: hypothetical protein JWM36_2859 [Hyphomicrobiales bacterium]|nr:hypothetical protein [Hyphomicrobiales bacterium]
MVRPGRVWFLEHTALNLRRSAEYGAVVRQRRLRVPATNSPTSTSTERALPGTASPVATAVLASSSCRRRSSCSSARVTTVFSSLVNCLLKSRHNKPRVQGKSTSKYSTACPFRRNDGAVRARGLHRARWADEDRDTPASVGSWDITELLPFCIACDYFHAWFVFCGLSASLILNLRMGLSRCCDGLGSIQGLGLAGRNPAVPVITSPWSQPDGRKQIRLHRGGPTDQRLVGADRGLLAEA